MSADGLLLREDVLDVAWVEQNYISVKNFLFQMTRPADERDIQNQKNENLLPPVTMESIEAGVPDFAAKESSGFGYGKVNNWKMTDLELCSIIDSRLIPKLLNNKPQTSIYMLPESKRGELFDYLWNESCKSRWQNASKGLLAGKYVSESQLRRCLCI